MIAASDAQLNLVTHSRQTDALRVLCVCSAGMLRSATAANVFHDAFGWNTRSAGSNETYALIPLSEVLIEWADRIIFVNRDNLTEALNNNPERESQIRKKATVLDIPDNYNWNAPELREEIGFQLKRYDYLRSL
jgi:predicted protein tyrosine phosphatase